ncbi:ATP/GTPbinding-like protein [Acanthamoeba castellanii str. Neff]|uniref:Nucleotide-binding protein-like n=1 Tax=Acanthamoeba castellanii (strain ATCC 30010 / Neff) TaxID=1257118 RepID=L8H212_ACACF|nr:ATP/GTPbinding-like protein [Acanthamoeba castellanii str. Neff]ELR19252.1 ATP/GTPbinding-like protein [Acanthamoeba castellanii str. Neff]
MMRRSVVGAASTRVAGWQKRGIKLPGVKDIIAVASGKGGVGKSTVSTNLALAISALGKRVALLDADVFGPSIPRMLNLSEQKPQVTDTQQLLPLSNYGIKCMSMGFLAEKDSPMIWRGPMVMGALEQLLRAVAWNNNGDVDVMVIDLPPGTGDTQLTLTQRVQLTGAVIVSTPQDIALEDARRGANMFRKVEVPILGLVENMSYFACPKCGEGARQTAKEMGMDFLGEVPLHMTIRETSDSGRPVVVSQPSSPQAEAFKHIARQVLDKIQDPAFRKDQEAPRIIYS